MTDKRAELVKRISFIISQWDDKTHLLPDIASHVLDVALKGSEKAIKKNLDKTPTDDWGFGWSAATRRAVQSIRSLMSKP